MAEQPICGRCGLLVPTKHAHKYGLNGYSCRPPVGDEPGVAPVDNADGRLAGNAGESTVGGAS